MISCSIAARGVLVLFPILGLSWGFGIIAVNHDALVWKYLFAIFTSLQVYKTENILLLNINGRKCIYTCLCRLPQNVQSNMC